MDQNLNFNTNYITFLFFQDATVTTTKTTTMTSKKLYGRDLSEYDNMDVDDLLAQLTPEELDILSREVDPDVSYPFST